MMEIDDLEKMITYDDVADVVSLLVLNGSPCYMNGSGKVTILENQEKLVFNRETEIYCKNVYSEFSSALHY